jgi:hypothetical protein
MIIERMVFQAKYGRGDELVAIFKEVGQSMSSGSDRKMRLLTDRSGPFFTMVAEIEWESLAEWEKAFAEEFNDPADQDLMARTIPLVESGRREFYHVEVEIG